jgi:hypothetical protein
MTDMETTIFVMAFMLLLAASGAIGAYLWMADGEAPTAQLPATPALSHPRASSDDTSHHMPLAA